MAVCCSLLATTVLVIQPMSSAIAPDDRHDIPYSGNFSWVQNFAEKPPDPPEETLVVFIFVGACMPRRRAGP